MNEAKSPETNEQKYLVVGGEVFSRADGDRHYVDAVTLCRLYGLNPSNKNVKLLEGNHLYLLPQADRFLKSFEEQGYIVLRTKYDGDYSLDQIEKT